MCSLRAGCRASMPRPTVALPPSPFRRFNFSLEVIRLVVLMYVRFSRSLRNVGKLLFERGIDICHETVRLWWNRFGSTDLQGTTLRRTGEVADHRKLPPSPLKDPPASCRKRFA